MGDIYNYEASIWHIVCVDSVCCQNGLAISSPTIDKPPNQPKTRPKRKLPENRLITYFCNGKYTPKRNLIINYDVMNISSIFCLCFVD